MSLAGKRIFITGGSRGIGLAIALKAARDGASVAIAAKTAEVNPKLPGTIYSASAEIEAAGGVALPIQCDLRDEDQITASIAKAAAEFGGIDILINNAGVWHKTGPLDTIDEAMLLQTVQVNLALQSPIALAQLADHVAAHALAQVAELVIGVDHAADVDLITQAFAQHRLLVALQLQGFGRGGRGLQAHTGLGGEGFDGPDRTHKQLLFGPRLALCLGKGLGREHMPASATCRDDQKRSHA